MPITARNFESLAGTLDGFSEKQVLQHLGLYKGYVNKYNEIQEKLTKVDRAATNYSFGEYSELRRREAVAFNGTYLHELYFENLAPKGKGNPSSALEQALKDAFGDAASWEADLKACGTSTPGWVLLCHNRTDGRLHHYIMYEHHIGLPVHQEPILALDCWEHAFMIDYGTNKADYMNAFVKNLDWSIVDARFQKAIKMATAA